jgi:hypothetical protein
MMTPLVTAFLVGAGIVVVVHIISLIVALIKYTIYCGLVAVLGYGIWHFYTMQHAATALLQ